MSRILMLGNSDLVIWNFRKELVQKLLDEQHEIYISAPYGIRFEDLKKLGCHYIDTPINRHGVNVLTDLKLLILYIKLMEEVQPDLILSYTIKPNVYGGFAASIYKVPYIMNITGFGIAIENQSFLSKFALFLYGLAAHGADCIFFQNQSNMQKLCRKRQIISKCHLLPGSGVNTGEFPYLEYPPKERNMMFLFLGRIMQDKGIEEFLRAAKAVKETCPSVEFVIVGECEQDYSGSLEQAVQEGIVSYEGFRLDVRNWIEKASAIVLPSYHEGLSNVLLEASACGRPVLASNIPGCKETFDEGITGFGFEPRSVESLEQTIEKFILLPHEVKEQMGIEARKKMEREFDRNIVINAYLEEINKIRNGGK